jgi:hypothetical protein
MCQDLPLGCLNCLFGMCGVKTETFDVVHEFTFLLEHEKILKFLQSYSMQFFYFFLMFRIFRVTEVWSMFRLLQTVLFLTDSVFDALFCLF